MAVFEIMDFIYGLVLQALFGKGFENKQRSTLLRAHGPLLSMYSYVLSHATKHDSHRPIQSGQRAHPSGRAKARRDEKRTAIQGESAHQAFLRVPKERCRRPCRLRKTLRAHVTSRGWSCRTTRGRRG